MQSNLQNLESAENPDATGLQATPNDPLASVVIEVPKPTNFDDFLTRTNPGGVDLYELQKNNQQANIPIRSEVRNTFDVDRLNTPENGLFQKALQAERRALYDGLISYKDQLARRGISARYIEFLRYFPNSRFTYINKLVKSGLKNGISRDDFDFLKTIWMSNNTRQLMQSFFAPLIKEGIHGYTVPPIQSRSGIPIEPVPGPAPGLKVALKNPGNMYFALPENTPTIDRNMDGLVTPDEIVEAIQHAMTLKPKPNSDELVGNEFIDSTLIGYYAHLRDELLKNTTSHEKVRSLVRRIMSYYTPMMSRYIESLLQPFNQIPARIAVKIPIPTAVFSTHRTYTLSTNAAGNVAFAWVVAYTTDQDQHTLAVNNDIGLTGLAPNNNFLAVATPQGALPVGLYAQTRVVSAGVRLTYVGSQLNSSGYLFCSSQNNLLSTAGQPPGGLIAQYADYGNFELIQNGFYSQSTASKSDSFIEVIYLPMDPRAENFTSVAGHNTQSQQLGQDMFTINGYLQGAQPSAAVLKLDMYATYEAIVDPASRDFIPTDYYRGDPLEIEKARMVVQKAVINQTMPKYEHIDNVSGLINMDKVAPQLAKDIITGKKDVMFKTPDTPGLWSWVKDKFKTFTSSIGDSLANIATSKGGKSLAEKIWKVASNFVPYGKAIDTGMELAKDVFPDAPSRIPGDRFMLSS